jgi:hypothetical protein
MRRVKASSRRWMGWALGVLAALTLAIAAPQHVLDFDEATGPVAEAQAHGHAHTVLDHATPGHDCAGHCAAHVIGGAPLPTRLPAPARVTPIWPAAAQAGDAVHNPILFERPPKA